MFSVNPAMPIVLFISALLTAPPTPIRDTTSDQTISRADKLKALEAQFFSERAVLFKAMHDGKLKKDETGGLPEYGQLQERLTGPGRKLIDEDPSDEVALDAILFSMHELVADASDPKLYDLLLSHHIDSPKLRDVVSRPAAPDDFLRAVVKESPHAATRDQANLALARRLWASGEVDKAERLLDELRRHPGDAAKPAEHLLYEIRNLSIGKVAPQVEEWEVNRDEQGKFRTMKLSEYHGKVVYLVFWATWCGPCMAMVPHEREVVKRFAGRPFAMIGVNGDGDDSSGPKIQEIIKREGITWRSFRGAPGVGIADRWNVTAWPTVYLIDHRGIIRDKFHFVGKEGIDALNEKIEKLVAAAEADRQKAATTTQPAAGNTERAQDSNAGSPVKAAEARPFDIPRLAVGKPAPEIKGADLDHRPMKLSDYHGNAVYLVFWATWCGPCMAMLPHERDLVKRYDNRPFAIVGVNGDGDNGFGPQVKNTIKNEQITWRSFAGGPGVGIAQQWNVRVWPSVWIIDHRGVIRLKFSGMGDDIFEALAPEIDKLVAAAEADRAHTANEP